MPLLMFLPVTNVPSAISFLNVVAKKAAIESAVCRRHRVGLLQNLYQDVFAHEA